MVALSAVSLPETNGVSQTIFAQQVGSKHQQFVCHVFVIYLSFVCHLFVICLFEVGTGIIPRSALSLVNIGTSTTRANKLDNYAMNAQIGPSGDPTTA